MNVSGIISYAPVGGFPAGAAVDHILVSLTGSNTANSQHQSVPSDTAAVLFANVAADSYTTSVQAYNTAGAALGVEVTGTLTVTAPATISLQLPATATFTQS